MKTFIKSLLVAFSFVVFGISAAQAETTPGTRSAAGAVFKTSFYATADGKLNVALDKEQGGYVDIRFINSAGNVLFVQTLGKQKQVSRLRLDISGLPDGVYQIAITNGVDTTTHALTVETPAPSVPSRQVAIN